MFEFAGCTPSIWLYMPEAEFVSLIGEGRDGSQPLKKNGKGIWHAKLGRSLQELQGKPYHFKVVKNGHTFTIADPLAHRTRRDERT